MATRTVKKKSTRKVEPDPAALNEFEESAVDVNTANSEVEHLKLLDAEPFEEAFNKELPVEDADSSIDKSCPGCDNETCVNGYLCGKVMHDPRARYVKTPPEIGFDVVVKATHSDGVTVEKFHFSKYCLARLRYFRVLFSTAMRGASSDEVDLTKFDSNAVLDLLIYLDPHVSSDSFNPKSSSQARKLLELLHAVGISAQLGSCQPCVCSIIEDAMPDDLALFTTYELDSYIGALVERLIVTKRASKLPREWYIDLFANKALPSGHVHDLVQQFVLAGYTTDAMEASLIVSKLQHLRDKLRTLYLVAGDKHFARALIADIGRHVSVGTWMSSELVDALGSIPAMINIMVNDGAVDQTPSPDPPQATTE